MAAPQSAQHIMRRCGAVLLAAGAIDIGWMAWRIGTGHDYSYSMALPAIFGGALLMRGSLQAAFYLAWIASVLLPVAVASGVIALLQPVDLTLTQLRLDPAGQIVAAVPLVLFCAVLYWLRDELQRLPVQSAFLTAGRRQPAVHVALGIGVVFALLALAGQQLGRDGGASDKAVLLAQQKHGDQFHYHASKISKRDDPQGSFVDATVLAWRADRVEVVDISWKDK
jgi:hypothetical protein